MNFEHQQTEKYYELGRISKEERNKLLDDITPQLWEELLEHNNPLLRRANV